jgi:hypothetical protein
VIYAILAGKQIHVISFTNNLKFEFGKFSSCLIVNKLRMLDFRGHSEKYRDVTPCSLVEVLRRFGGSHCLQLQAASRALLVSCLRLSGCLLGNFDPEDRGRSFFRNVGGVVWDYTA